MCFFDATLRNAPGGVPFLRCDARSASRGIFDEISRCSFGSNPPRAAEPYRAWPLVSIHLPQAALWMVARSKSPASRVTRDPCLTRRRRMSARSQIGERKRPKVNGLDCAKCPTQLRAACPIECLPAQERATRFPVRTRSLPCRDRLFERQHRRTHRHVGSFVEAHTAYVASQGTVLGRSGCVHVV